MTNIFSLEIVPPVADHTPHTSYVSFLYIIRVTCHLFVIVIFLNHEPRYRHRKRASTTTDTMNPVHVDKDTMVIAYFLQYLKFRRLNIHCDLVKGFWSLINWGSGIANKDEFISSCSPDLAPR